MKSKQCINGHHFDAEMYPVCPICGQPDISSSGGPNPQYNSYSSTVSYDDTVGKTVPGADYNASQQGCGMGPGGSGFYNGMQSDDNKTVPGTLGYNPSYYPGGNDPSNFNDNGQTIAASMGGVYGFAPVTGWLVCIDGPERGKDYPIREGYNYIGRGSNMNICLRGDDHISREKHSKIAYDDKEHIFFFGPEQGAGLVRVNDKLVMNQVILEAYDVITIGSTKLIFIPLCSDRFNWNQMG